MGSNTFSKFSYSSKHNYCEKLESATLFGIERGNRLSILLTSAGAIIRAIIDGKRQSESLSKSPSRILHFSFTSGVIRLGLPCTPISSQPLPNSQYSKSTTYYVRISFALIPLYQFKYFHSVIPKNPSISKPRLHWVERVAPVRVQESKASRAHQAFMAL